MENSQANFLDTALCYVHIQAASVIAPLPQYGIALELIKRVAVAVIAPFAFLALAFCKLVQYVWTSLVGRAEREQPRDDIPLQPEVIPVRNVLSENEYNKMFAKHALKVVEKVRKDIIASCCEAENINSIKIGYRISTEKNSVTNKVILRNDNPLEDFNKIMIDSLKYMFASNVKYFNIDKLVNVNIVVYVFIKEKDGTLNMGCVRNKSLDSDVLTMTLNTKIGINAREEAAKLYLEGEGFEYIPQFNEKGDFIDG